ncbi:5,10-methylene tetrahydromethanopterin reductase [Pigmentiphaga sp. NML080357]|uniref:LLM class flavin-dependent oxidoreductase n=1 Tax=Pigmentiphaga sp. NML080357 TaxID=2008675 RepID=UPI000B40DC4F|nr:LLM class flavin-dependent oxidoreductase [Pigmentiphaga sp. NML080357]OVZ58812.1 5,10-methylene tetrahydromethanopterin reductase [Pigmentiphaga sp. NML080357]
MSLKLSVLDLSPIPSGHTPTDALANSVDLARQAEAAGYHRYWLAEHHNTGMLACSAPELLITRIAGATSRLRVGSGGIMLPNHSPLKVAETFRVLEAMFPQRIDLGLGRAPGTDPVTASALRRGHADADDFPRQLSDLVGYLKDAMPADHPHARVRATPVGVPCPPIWILGSSLYGARVAAANGFGFAYAHHIVPENVHAAMRLYREEFRASPFGHEPRAILAVSAICAPTAEEAERLAATADLSMMRTRSGRTRYPLPSVEEALAYAYQPDEEALRQYNRTRIHIGTPGALAASIGELARATDADEVMVNTMIHRHEDRVRSYRLLAPALMS